MPLALLGLGLGAAVTASSMTFVDRYAEAPGEASDVNSRLAFSAVPRYEAKGKILFVTVAGPRLTGLQAAIGWLDPDVSEQTHKQRYGDRTPDQDHQVNLRAMRTAKDDAPYVAMTRLGYPTERKEGPAVIQQMICLDASADGLTCLKFFPADSFLNPGDLFVSIDGSPIDTIDALSAALKPHKPGDSVEVVVRRDAAPDGPTETGTVTLSSAGANESDRAIFGIQMADTTQVTLPFPVDIDTGQIGGPSAGLAFTLTVLDELTPGELTGGKKVAVTGTIDVDGNVGPIGGLHQKAVAVRSAGADIFIVPKSQSDVELAEARRIFGAERVFPVDTVDDALAVLKSVGGNAADLGTPGADYHAT